MTDHDELADCVLIALAQVGPAELGVVARRAGLCRDLTRRLLQRLSAEDVVVTCPVLRSTGQRCVGYRIAGQCAPEPRAVSEWAERARAAVLKAVREMVRPTTSELLRALGWTWKTLDRHARPLLASGHLTRWRAGSPEWMWAAERRAK